MTAIPVLVPPASGVLTRAYVTNAMFRAFPTWLDTDDLIQSAQQSAQDDALADVLLTASDWAVGVLEDMPLHAHWVQNETFTTRVKSTGRVYVTPQHVPVRAVTSLSWGGDPSWMQAVSLPDASMWFEDGRRMSWAPGGVAATFRGPALQFGAPAAPSRTVYADLSYIAGFPFALLPSGATQGAMSVTVDDPTGILPGDVLRIYDPGLTEALTVAATYVPAMPMVPPTPTSVPLAAATVNAHIAGTGITGFPRKALQAVIALGVALLMREDVSGEEPASGFGPDARTTSGTRGGQASGLVNDAYGWLAPYKPVLRS